MKLKILLLASSILVFSHAFSQVGINTTTPNAQLDIVSSDKGVLVPRIALSATNIAAPVTSATGGAPERSTLIFNTATVEGEHGVVPGFYYWDDQWIPIGGPESKDWKSTGNVATNPAENFIGTIDNAPISFRTNNAERLRVSTNNQIFAMNGGSQSSPFYSWFNDQDTGIWRASSDVLALGANNMEGLTINMASTNPTTIINADQTEMDFQVKTTGSENTLFVKGNTDNVGVGTAEPTAKLHINGDVKIANIPTDLSSNKILVVGENNVVSQNVMPNFFGISGLVIPICRNISEGDTGNFQTTVNGVVYSVDWEILNKEDGTSVYWAAQANNRTLKAQGIQVKYDFNPPLPFEPDGFSLTGYNNSNYPDTFSLNYTNNSAASITVNITRTDITSTDQDEDCWTGQFYFDMTMYRY